MIDWDFFIKALIVRFCPIAYDDPIKALTKLRQSGTVEEYKARFETLSNWLKGLSDTYKLSCFLIDLRDDIHLPIRMFNPQNFT